MMRGVRQDEDSREVRMGLRRLSLWRIRFGRLHQRYKSDAIQKY
jgi:hypothetical protein